MVIPKRLKPFDLLLENTRIAFLLDMFLPPDSDLKFGRISRCQEWLPILIRIVRNIKEVS